MGGLLDPSANELVERYYHRVLRFLVRLTGSLPDGEDLTQTTFVLVLERIAEVGSVRDPRAYLMQVAYNTWCRWKRSRSTSQDALGELRPGPGESQCPAEACLSAEWVRRVRSAFAELPSNHQATLVLIVLEEMSYEEAGAIMAVSRDTIATWRRRALRRLRRRLTDEQVLFAEQADSRQSGGGEASSTPIPHPHRRNCIGLRAVVQRLTQNNHLGPICQRTRKTPAKRRHAA